MFELVFCVGHENTFCVLESAFTHNMPTLGNLDLHIFRLCSGFHCVVLDFATESVSAADNERT